MKIEVYNKFQPIEIKLVIESEEELCDLYHRLNQSKNSVESNRDKGIKYGAGGEISPLYFILSDLVSKYNLR